MEGLHMTMNEAKMLQKALFKAGFYNGRIDGLIGPKTRKAALIAADQLEGSIRTIRGDDIVGAVQIIVNAKGDLPKPIKVDGFYGPATEAAIESYIGFKAWRHDHRFDASGDQWPAYRDATRFFGEPGTNQVIMELPYEMVLAWDESQSVNRFSINAKCADSAKRVLQRSLDYYGYDRIKDLGLHKFGGCLNVRKMRGGTQLSTHSWGSAIDFDPARNRLRWKSDRAELAKPEYRKFWNLWEAEGWTSLGRRKNYDWMHVQAMS